MTPIDRLIILALCGAWLIDGIDDGVRCTRALVRHCIRALVRYLRRRRNRITFRIVGAPYSGAPGLGK